GFLVMILLRETLPSKIDVNEMEQKAKGLFHSIYEYRSVLYDKRFVLFVLIGVLIELLYSQSSTTLPVYSVGEGIITTKMLGYIWALNGWSIVVFQMAITRFMEKRNMNHMMALGSLIYALSFLVLLKATGFPMMVLFMSVFTLAEMIIAPIQMTFVANHAPEDMRGRYMGFYSLAWGLGGSTGPFIGGRIMDVYSSRLLWMFITIVGVLASIGYLISGRMFKERNEEDICCTE
nr:MFS transporter [Candidatus Methanofastidiosa archaeon]